MGSMEKATAIAKRLSEEYGKELVKDAVCYMGDFDYNLSKECLEEQNPQKPSEENALKFFKLIEYNPSNIDDVNYLAKHIHQHIEDLLLDYFPME